MHKNIFITGAAGFIGFHAALCLKSRGYQVIGYDNFNDYYTPQLKRDRAAQLKKNGIEVIEGDLLDAQKMKQAVTLFETTHILHLAAQAGVRYSLKNPKSYLNANIDGFLNVLEICRENPVIKLTYASSSSVYGLNEEMPYAITDRTDQQASLYGVTKKTNELMASSYHHLFGISVTGLRFFTVYGPWGRPDMAYFLFTQAILENRPIEIFHGGKMSRDFTYIDDIVDGIVSAIDKESPCALFNLGNNQPEQLLDLIAILEELLEHQAIKTYRPLQAGDVISTYANINESVELLNFHPKTDLRSGLEKFVNWYKGYYISVSPLLF